MYRKKAKYKQNNEDKIASTNGILPIENIIIPKCEKVCPNRINSKNNNNEIVISHILHSYKIN